MYSTGLTGVSVITVQHWASLLLLCKAWDRLAKLGIWLSKRAGLLMLLPNLMIKGCLIVYEYSYFYLHARGNCRCNIITDLQSQMVSPQSRTIKFKRRPDIVRPNSLCWICL